MIIRKFSRCSPDVKCFYLNPTVLTCIVPYYDMIVLKLHNNSLRKLLGIPKYNSASEMFVCLNIPSFDELFRKYVYSFRNRLVSSQNCILISICSSIVPLYSIIWAWWESILTL